MEYKDQQMIDPVELEHTVDEMFDRHDKLVAAILNQIIEVVHEREQIQGE
jgi:hypothetical protein